MAHALEQPGIDPTYLEYFGLRRPPFTRLTNPSEVFHTEQYSLLMDHLANATKQSDCIVVVCGADGCGKTTLLNRHVSSLGDDICFARIDESYKSVKQFYCEFLRQLGFRDIDGKPDELRRITKEFLVNRGMAGDPVLLIVDNAHLIHPNVFEQFRWLAAIKVDEVRVLSSILAGNSDLERVMDSPAMRQLAFNKYVHFHIRAFTEAETANYVWNRLKLAGGVDAVTISNEAHPLIHRYTGGVPRLINILCNAVLAEAHARESSVITDELLRTVADNRQLVPHVLPHQGKGRRRTDLDFKLARVEGQSASEAQNQDNYDELPPSDNENGEPDTQVNVPAAAVPEHTASDVNLKSLFQQLSRLSLQVDTFKADKARTFEEVSLRDTQISDLRKQLDAQSVEAEILAQMLGDKTGEREQLSEAVIVSTTALQDSEKALMQLASELEDEKDASNTAQIELAEARERVDELGWLEIELQETAKDLVGSEERVVGLKCELSDAMEAIANLADDVQLADERRVDIDALEKMAADLNKKIQAMDDELQIAQDEMRMRDEAIADLERKKDARIADLEGTLAAHDQETNALEAKIEELDSERQAREEELGHLKGLETCLLDSHEKIPTLEVELESREGDLADVERIATLEAELQESNRILTETQAQLAETAKLIPRPKTDTDVSSELKVQPAARELPTAPDAAAEHSGAAIKTFEIIKNDEPDLIIEIDEGQRRIMIGRDEDNDLLLDSGFVSRHHAIIVFSDDGPFIEDLNSLNGTLINSKKITRCDLRIGDIVSIGDFQIMPGPA